MTVIAVTSCDVFNTSTNGAYSVTAVQTFGNAVDDVARLNRLDRREGVLWC